MLRECDLMIWQGNCRRRQRMRKSLAKRNQCFKCHAVDKAKQGPSLLKIARKYKDNEVAGEAAMIKSITTGPIVKLEDGTLENHTTIDIDDRVEMRNLVRWILSLQHPLPHLCENSLTPQRWHRLRWTDKLNSYT